MQEGKKSGVEGVVETAKEKRQASIILPDKLLEDESGKCGIDDNEKAWAEAVGEKVADFIIDAADAEEMGERMRSVFDKIEEMSSDNAVELFRELAVVIVEILGKKRFLETNE